MTFAELKAEIENLTPAQLAMPVLWWGDERGGEIDRVMVLEEDWIDDDDGGSVARSDCPGAPDDAEIVHAKGTPVLCTDE